MLDLEKLNDHSRTFAHRLFREFPDWIRFARFDPYEDFEKEALLVEVPRPTDGSGNGLFITTSEWEVAVGFGENFHTRFGAGDDADCVNFLDEAMDFIRDFVAERIAVATAQQGREWLGAWKIELAAENIDLPEQEEGVVVTVRSWLGTYDREIR